MSANNTPGPWLHTSVEGGWDGVCDASGRTLCKLVLNEPENATLMGAAPELLAVCVAIEEYAAPLGAGLLEQLRAVLAKATL